MKTNLKLLVLFLLTPTLLPSAFAAEERKPQVCLRMDATEKNVDHPVTPEGKIKKTFFNLMAEHEIDGSVCDGSYYSYQTDGRMELMVTIENVGKSKKEPVLNATMKTIYYKITRDGRNEKMWESEFSTENQTEEKVREALKKAAEEKLQDFFKTAKPIEKYTRGKA